MVNKVILLGYVGAAPVVRTLESGVAMARLRMATSESVYDARSGQSRQFTQWHDVVLWREHATLAGRYADKGAMVYVEGRIRSRESDVAGAGLVYEVVGDVFKVLNSDLLRAEKERRKQQQNSAAGEQQSPSDETPNASFKDLAQVKGPDDIPF